MPIRRYLRPWRFKKEQRFFLVMLQKVENRNYNIEYRKSTVVL